MFCGRREFTWLYIIRRGWRLNLHFWVTCSFKLIWSSVFLSVRWLKLPDEFLSSCYHFTLDDEPVCFCVASLFSGLLHHYYLHFLQWVEARRLWRSCEDVFLKGRMVGPHIAAGGVVWRTSLPRRSLREYVGQRGGRSTHSTYYIYKIRTSAPSSSSSSSSSSGCEQIKRARDTQLIKHSGVTVDSCSTSAVPAALSERWKPSTPQLQFWRRRKSQLLHVPTVQIAKRSNERARVWETETSPRWGRMGSSWIFRLIAFYGSDHDELDPPRPNPWGPFYDQRGRVTHLKRT